MSLENINLYLFGLINAQPNASEFSIGLATFIANDTFYVMLAGLIFFWFRGTIEVKKQVAKAVVFTSIAMLIGQFILLIYYHPRPFIMDVGHTFIPHSADSSFPSDHMLIFSTIAFSYLFSKKRTIGICLMFFAWVVAWSRVYLGVHFPMDMFGTFFIALALNLVGQPLWSSYSDELMKPLLKSYNFLFSKLIQTGLIK